MQVQVHVQVLIADITDSVQCMD